jgi:hypothetical protein
MFETRTSAAETQQELWIDARRLPKATASTFYRKLDETLDSIGFAEGVREVCRPAYAELSRGGRPGIDPDDTKAVRRFDKNREGRKTSNQEWVNPHDPDAKVGMTKHGACDMIYKPEHITDLDTGIIVAAEVRCGDEGDTVGLAGRVLAAGEVLARVCEDPDQTKVLTSLTADEGYFAVEETCCLQLERVRFVIGDPHESKRKRDKQDAVVRQVLHKAKQAVASKSGKALLRKRGEHLERSFCHVLDHGKHRRATLRGRKNLTKRQLAAAFTHNLSGLMRYLTGHGTPKQWPAAADAFFGMIAALWDTMERLATGWTRRLRRYRFNQTEIAGIVVRVASRLNFTGDSEIRRFSTGCWGHWETIDTSAWGLQDSGSRIGTIIVLDRFHSVSLSAPANYGPNKEPRFCHLRLQPDPNRGPISRSSRRHPGSGVAGVFFWRRRLF